MRAAAMNSYVEAFYAVESMTATERDAMLLVSAKKPLLAKVVSWKLTEPVAYAEILALIMARHQPPPEKKRGGNQYGLLNKRKATYADTKARAEREWAES
jgi:hypothetical protein